MWLSLYWRYTKLAKPVPHHCCKSWSAQAWKLLGNVHMCPSQCPSMYTPPVYKKWPSSSSSVQGVSKLVHMLCTNWALAWAHVYISKQFPSLGIPTSTAVHGFWCAVHTWPEVESNFSSVSLSESILASLPGSFPLRAQGWCGSHVHCH